MTPERWQQIQHLLQQALEYKSAERSSIGIGTRPLIYVALGEKDEAFSMLDKAFEGRDFILVFLNHEPLFDGLRSDMLFADLVRRVGLPHKV